MAYLSTMAIRPLTDREFRLFRDLIEREAGIFLAPHKKTLLVARLSRRLRALGLSSFHDYYRRVAEDGTGEERVRMLDRICTNETHFFREPAQFEFLERQVIPEWERAAAAGLRRRRIRVWSAACSSGEEPFSLAMSLLWHCPPAAGKLDLIFCRNVLIYFTAESRHRVVRRLLDLLAPGGLLFLGHSESLTGLSHEVQSVFPTVYARHGDESVRTRSNGRVA